MNLIQIKHGLTDLKKKLMVARGEGCREGIGREFVIYIQTVIFKMNNQPSPTV